MTNQDFNFDPLPGDLPAQPAARPPADKPAGKKRGRKPKGEGKKPARKPAAAPTALHIPSDRIRILEPGEKVTGWATASKQKPGISPYPLIRQLMVLSEAERRHVLDALNEVFG